MSILSSTTHSVVRCVGLANVSRMNFIVNQKLHASTSISTDEAISKMKEYAANLYEMLPIVATKGKDVYLWDTDGKKYLDFFGGFACLSQGHCHPKIVKAMQEQAETLHIVSQAIYNDQAPQLVEYMSKLFGYDKVLLANTGVEGGEAAVKLARKWGYRVKKIPENKAGIIFAEENFWGRTLAAVSASTSPTSYKEFGPLMPGYHWVPYNNLAKLEEKLKDPTICAFMVEPIQGEAGAVVPESGYLTEVRKLCTKYNVLWIDDEVQAGLARTGKLLAIDYENVKPDILILGKALAGGLYPVSAILANKDLMDQFEPGTHGSTFGANPLASRVALASLKVIVEEKLSENAFKMGEIFRSELVSKLSKEKVTAVRGKGLLNCLILEEDVLDSKDVCHELLHNGLISKPIKENMIRFSPPLTIAEAQLREGINIIVQTINSLPTKKLD